MAFPNRILVAVGPMLFVGAWSAASDVDLDAEKLIRNLGGSVGRDLRRLRNLATTG